MDIVEFEKMMDVFYRVSYYLCCVVVEFGILKFVFVSSNYVIDVYEKDGCFFLGWEIIISDYLLLKNLYGVLKLILEQIGYLFYLENKFLVINF